MQAVFKLMIYELIELNIYNGTHESNRNISQAPRKYKQYIYSYKYYNYTNDQTFIHCLIGRGPISARNDINIKGVTINIYTLCFYLYGTELTK